MTRETKIRLPQGRPGYLTSLHGNLQACDYSISSAVLYDWPHGCVVYRWYSGGMSGTEYTLEDAESQAREHAAGCLEGGML